MAYLSTDEVIDRDRFAYWQSFLEGAIGKIELLDCDVESFHAHLDFSAIGDLHVVHFQGSRQTLRRSQPMIKSSDSDHYVLVLESDKTFNIDHCGQQRSGRNGMVLLDIARPRMCSHPEGAEITEICIPRERMERAFGSARSAAGLALEPSHPTFPLISSLLNGGARRTA